MFKKITDLTKKNSSLILIAVFYLVLIGYRFVAQGLVNWDEAYFMMVVHTFSKVIRLTLSDPIGLFSNHFFYQNLMADYNNVYTAARPAYILPAILIDLIWPSEFSTRILSAASGLLALVFFYRNLSFFSLGKRTKLAATFFLAASPLFIIYSRLGLSQIFSAAFFLIVAHYLIRFGEEKKPIDLKIFAAALSVLLMSHYNTIPLVGLFFLIVFFILWRQRQSWKRYAIFLVYFLWLPVIWEIITRLGALLATAKGMLTEENQAKVLSYSQELFQQFHKAEGGHGFIFDQIFYYPRLFLSTEGLVFIVLFAAGLFFALKKFRQLKYISFLIVPLIYLILFSFVPLKFPRNIIVVLPAFYVLAASGLKLAAKLLAPKFEKKGKDILLAIFCLTIIALNFSQYKNILNIQTNFQEIAAFIKTSYAPEEIAIFSNSTPVWRNYLYGYRSETPPKITNPVFAEPGRKIIFISDYFTSVHEGRGYPAGFSARPLKETSTNIFLVKPVVMDFIDKSEELMKKMFADKNNGLITVYELIPE